MKRRITGLLLPLIWMSGCNLSQTEKTFTIQSNEQNKTVPELSEKVELPENFTSSLILDPISHPITDFISKPALIVSVGDSLTQGIGDRTNNGGYLPYLEKKLEEEPAIHSVKMVNYGMMGNQSDQLLKRLDKDEIRNDIVQADSIVVTIGGNDIMKVFKQNFTHLEMEQFTSAESDYEVVLRQILDKIRSYNKSTPIYLVGVYNPFSKTIADLYELDLIVANWNKSGQKIIAEYDSAYFIKIEDIFKNTEEDLLYTEDYFHPNDRGYELIATRIYNDMDISTFGSDTIETSAKGDEEQQ